MKNKLGILFKRLIFSFGIIYGVNIVLKSVGVYIPINIITIAVTSLLGIPGLLSIFAIFYLIY